MVTVIAGGCSIVIRKPSDLVELTMVVSLRQRPQRLLDGNYSVLSGESDK